MGHDGTFFELRWVCSISYNNTKANHPQSTIFVEYVRDKLDNDAVLITLVPYPGDPSFIVRWETS